MRRSCLAAVALLLFVTPALAQQQGQQPAGTTRPQTRQTVLGSYTCSDPVPCYGSTDAASVTTDQWATYGNSCMASGFGYANPQGFIDDSAGLDSNGCMTSKTQATQSAGSLTPRCCVVVLPSGACSVHCDLVK